MGRPSVRRFGHSMLLNLSPTTSAGIYASGDVIGTQMTIVGAVHSDYGGSVLQSVQVIDKIAQSSAMDLMIFNAPITSTVTDNAAVALTATEMNTLLAVINVASADFITFSTGVVPTAVSYVSLDIPLQADGERNLYGLVVSKGTPTYGDTDALLLRLGILRDD